MGSDVERMARLWQLPLDVVVRYATVTRTFVEVPVERWATGRYVPTTVSPAGLPPSPCQATVRIRRHA